MTIQIDPQPAPPPVFALMPISEAPPLGVLIAGWISSLESARSRETYQHSLKSFVQYTGAATLEEAITGLMLNPRQANLVVQSFREWLRNQLYTKGSITRAYSTASINLKLAALRSLVEYIDTNGTAPALNLKVKGMKSRTLRDVRGPDHDEIQLMLDALGKRIHTPKGKRDYAMFRLLKFSALRRQEVIGIQLEDFHGSWISITGKGHTEKEPLMLDNDGVTRAAIEEWIAARGDHPGPLFNITGSGLLKMVKRLGIDALGRPVTVHSLRHAYGTEASDRGHGLMAIQHGMRHSNPATTQRYIHSAANHAGTISADLSRGYRLPTGD